MSQEAPAVIAVLRAALSSVVDIVLKKGTPEQIELMWGALKTAEAEAQRVVPLAKKADVIRPEEWQ
jgi:hypothetical protein